MLLLDFSTSWYHRYATPVGIVRCEHELARYILKHHGDVAQLGVFDHERGAYRRLGWDSVVDLLNEGSLADEAKRFKSRKIVKSLRPSRLFSIGAVLMIAAARMLNARIFESIRIPVNSWLAKTLQRNQRRLDHAVLEKYVPTRCCESRFFQESIAPLIEQVKIETKSPLNAPLIPYGDIELLVQAGIFWDGDKARIVCDQKRVHGFRLAALIYDLIPVKIPQFSEAGASLNFPLGLHHLLWSVDKFACISRSTERDLRHHAAQCGYRDLEGDTAVVPLGPAHSLKYRQSEDPPWDTHLEPGRFVLLVSTIEARKNHAFAYQLWRRLVEMHGERTMPLIFVGYAAWGTDDLMHIIRRDWRLYPRFIFQFENIHDAQLAWLYRNCAFTIFPSHYEGWGMPISESLAFGKPCVAADGSSMREAGQGLAVHFDVLDGRGWLAQIEKYMFDDEHRAEMQEKIRKNYSMNDWNEFAASFMKHAVEGSVAGHVPDRGGRRGN